MASARTQHKLARSMRRLAVDIVKDVERRKAGDLSDLLVEREEQVQVNVRGTATSSPAFGTVEIDFDQKFTMAGGRRMSMLDRPQVWFGYEITVLELDAGAVSQTAGVMLVASVSRWIYDDATNIVGATLRIGATAAGRVGYRGVVHATFQGYGLLTDQEDIEG